MKKIIIILILTIGLNIINVNAENIAINEEVGTIKEELENPQTGESAPCGWQFPWPKHHEHPGNSFHSCLSAFSPELTA